MIIVFVIFINQLIDYPINLNLVTSLSAQVLVTIFTLNILTPQLLTILVRKFEQVQFTICCVQKLLDEWQTV